MADPVPVDPIDPSIDKGFTDWQDAIEKFAEEQQQRDADVSAYKARLAAFNAKTFKDPMVGIQILILYVMMNLDTNGTAFGIMDDQIGVKGSDLDVSTKGNDLITKIQALMQKKSDDPKDVVNFAKDLDKYLDQLTTLQKLPDDQKPIDPAELKDIKDAVTDMRNQIYLGNGDSHDPTDPNSAVMWPTSQAVPDGHFNSFGKLFDGAQDKNPTIQQAASDGIKAFTNDLNKIQTNFGAVNQAIKVQLQSIQNTQKAALGWYDNGALHMISDVTKLATNNQKS